jgi:hypothetical protein
MLYIWFNLGVLDMVFLKKSEKYFCRGERRRRIYHGGHGG